MYVCVYVCVCVCVCAPFSIDVTQLFSCGALPQNGPVYIAQNQPGFPLVLVDCVGFWLNDSFKKLFLLLHRDMGSSIPSSEEFVNVQLSMYSCINIPSGLQSVYLGNPTTETSLELFGLQ